MVADAEHGIESFQGRSEQFCVAGARRVRARIAAVPVESVEQIQLNGAANGLGPGAALKRREDAGGVHLDSPRAERELACDGLVGLAR